MRLFESMMCGISPVIISDKWIFPKGLCWNDFSLTVREKNLGQLEEIVTSRESQHKEMGMLARKAYEEYFEEGVYFNYIVSNCLAMMKAQLIPESGYWRLRRPIAFYWNLKGKLRSRLDVRMVVSGWLAKTKQLGRRRLIEKMGDKAD